MKKCNDVQPFPRINLKKSYFNAYLYEFEVICFIEF